MSWIQRLENKFGHWAIPNLMWYVAALTALCYGLIRWNPDYLGYLTLEREALLQGQVWRLLTYLFIPRIGGWLPDWFVTAFYILYLIWVGNGLEQAWGSFRMNLYYMLGMAGTTIAALIANSDPTGAMLNTTLFLAFARFYPDAIIYFMFILPVKIVWMAWVTAAFLLLGLLFGSWEQRLAIVAGLVNFLIFFGRDLYEGARTRRQVGERRQRFQNAMREEPGATMHQCKVCGRTELSAPNLEFRVSDDGEEYCTDHLPGRPS